MKKAIHMCVAAGIMILVLAWGASIAETLDSATKHLLTVVLLGMGGLWWQLNSDAEKRHDETMNEIGRITERFERRDD